MTVNKPPYIFLNIASTCKAGDLGLVPGLGRSPGGEHGNPLQDSCCRIPAAEFPWTEEPSGL